MYKTLSACDRSFSVVYGLNTILMTYKFDQDLFRKLEDMSNAKIDDNPIKKLFKEISDDYDINEEIKNLPPELTNKTCQEIFLSVVNLCCNVHIKGISNSVTAINDVVEAITKLHF